MKKYSQISEIEQNLQKMDDVVANGVPVKSGRQLVAGDVIAFDIVDDNEKVLGGQESINGTTNVNKVLACTRNGKNSTMNFGELIRYAYETIDAEKQTPACDVCAELFKSFRGLTMSQILEKLAHKSFKVVERKKAYRRQWQSTDGKKEETTVAVLQQLDDVE